MWMHNHFTPFEPNPPIWEMIRNVTIRYFLVALPVEHQALGALIDKIEREGEISPTGPVDATDAEVLSTTLIRQLSIRHDKGAPIKLQHIKILTDYALKCAESLKRVDLHIPMFTAAFGRLWYELDRTGQHTVGESWEKILLYVTLFIDAVVTLARGV
ncbi:hypothetical protein BDV93DRAFT_512491 [Ceratobasidium sp. AG-I]|nr:hypothetical protein BDV93DRAFT_512491 [Ceratobasidium sp. AG-I]